MLTMPYLSVIIPCYNCRKTIERLLDSIVANGFSKDELEVGDKVIIEKIDGVKLVVRKEKN